MKHSTTILTCGLLLACSDSSIKAVNSAPSATITSHREGDVVAANEDFTLVGAVSDPDDPGSSLTATWMWGETTLCAETSTDVDGLTLCTVALPAGEAIITLLARDGRGGTGSAQIGLISSPPLSNDTGEDPDDTGEPPEDTGEITLNTSPTCSITAPADGAILRGGAEASFYGAVADAEQAAETLAIRWTSDVEGLLGSDAADSSGSAHLSTPDLSAGSHLITLSATDSDAATCTSSIAITVDGQPSTPEVVIEPGPARTADDLTAVIVTPSTDPEGEAVSYRYEWLVDGTPTAFTDSTILAAETAKGQDWEVRVTPSDSLGDGSMASAERTISNTPPSTPTIEISPAAPVEGVDDLSCSVISPSTDADADAVTTAISWQVDGIAFGGTPTASDTAEGQIWTCTATPNDGEADGTPATASVRIDALPTYRWIYRGTDRVGMIYGSCAHVESYSATCTAALTGERVYINESGGAALERKALGETHLADEPGGRGYSVSLSADELEITWTGATGCGADWLQTDTVDIYECIEE